MKQDPSPTTSPATKLSVQVRVLWGDDALSVHHLPCPGSLWIGEAVEGGAPCTVAVDQALLGAPQVELLVADRRGRVGVAVLPGASGTVELGDGDTRDLHRAFAVLEHDTIEGVAGARRAWLPQGARASLRLGQLTFHVSTGRAEVRQKRRLPWRAARALAACCALSFGVHGCVGAASFYAPAPERVDGELTEDQYYLIRHYLDAVEEARMEEEEKERETVDLSEEQADNREGGSGTRAGGNEGSMGARTGHRYGVRGPSDQPRVARQAAVREAAEFGMIGLMNSGAGGDPDAPTAPWGRDDALGNMWGDSIGPAHGAGGLGLSGAGQGGAGKGQGIGLGSAAGHGAGAGTGQGFGSGTGHGRLGRSHRSQQRVARSHRPIPSALARSPHVSEAAERPARQVAIDPNGRFSTSYRPGGGHLAAFESAVARGIVPIAARALVSDVGASYAPALPMAEDRALAHDVRLERAALPPDGGPVHVRVALQSTPQSPMGRPQLSVHLVMDVSGSMQGDSIARAADAAHHLVEQLAPTDTFSFTTFSDRAFVGVHAGPVAGREKMIHATIGAVSAGGGTNIGEGLELAYGEAMAHARQSGAVPVVLLLSDGQATAGERDPVRLSAMSLEAFQGGIQTSSFGLGTQYDGQLMSALAQDGAGGYYYLRDTEQIAPAFRAELEQRLDPAATAVEVRVRLDEDVELLHVYGSKRLGARQAARERAKEVAADVQAQQRYGIARDRQRDPKGGMRFFIPSFARDDSYALLFKVHAPAGRERRRMAAMELRYKDRVSGRNVIEERIIELDYADSDAQSAASVDESVACTVQGHLAGEDLLLASQHIAQGDPHGATSVLAERARILRLAAESLGELEFLEDADRLSRLLAHASGQGSLSEPRALAMVMETAARAHLR